MGQFGTLLSLLSTPLMVSLLSTHSLDSEISTPHPVSPIQCRHRSEGPSLSPTNSSSGLTLRFFILVGPQRRRVVGVRKNQPHPTNSSSLKAWTELPTGGKPTSSCSEQSPMHYSAQLSSDFTALQHPVFQVTSGHGWRVSILAIEPPRIQQGLPPRSHWQGKRDSQA